MKLIDRSHLNAPVAVAAIMALAFVLLLMRSSGIYPTVFGDEYTYSSMARVLPLSSASIPNYLYLSIYKSTLMCGDGFMGCTKLLNALFFVLASPFIFMVARRYCSARASVLIVALSMLGPINGYTTYFMPEALFYLTFWMSAWYFLTLASTAPWQQWALLGVLMGCSSLVKPHAMFVIPGFCLCIAYFAYKDLDRWFVTALKNAVVFVGVMMLVKFGFSYLVAGKAGLTLFGNFYATTLESSASSLDRYLAILRTAPTIAAGHLLGNAVMFGCALAAIITTSIATLKTREIGENGRFAFFTLFLLLNLIAVVALFSASVAGTNAVETALRLHMRYYDFLFPLLFIAAGAELAGTQLTAHRYVRWAVAIVIMAAVLYAGITRMHPFTLSFIDNPELRGFTFRKKLFVVLALLSLISLILWCTKPRKGTQLFLFIYLPLSILVSTVYASISLLERRHADAYDKAGMFARQYLPVSERPHLLVVGDNPASILRALFWVEDLNAGPDLSYKPGAIYTADQSPADKKWILIVGDVEVAKGDFKVLQLNGFSLARKLPKVSPLVLDFRTQINMEAVELVRGFSYPESWGAWSNADTVTLQFARPLPKAFVLEINAKAFGPNQNQNFEVKVDDRRYPLRLSAEVEPYSVKVDNPDEVNKLTIKVPQATSPEQMGMNGDKRLLGIGIRQIVIREVE
ncbi:phosphoglycerol transferase [Pseudomonas sp. S60]|uniref:ArnT family glycosyltransferase n=1 Tax=Pseudomonas sp. S60 TaxID=211124 RepID=UPI001912344F|nr:glycosyltransferase family 39 protein [Pseudomonas sp. S60]MBK5012066.1 phosphoglycerol transferase [Pseudomonas sp. S60]